MIRSEWRWCVLFKGNENIITAQHLMSGEVCIVKGTGQSMTPIIKSKQEVMVEPITKDTNLKKNDIVFCKVKGNYYIHKISAIKNDKLFQISNNHKHVNGWISKENIYGKVIKIL